MEKRYLVIMLLCSAFLKANKLEENKTSTEQIEKIQAQYHTEVIEIEDEEYYQDDMLDDFADDTEKIAHQTTKINLRLQVRILLAVLIKATQGWYLNNIRPAFDNYVQALIAYLKPVSVEEQEEDTEEVGDDEQDNA